MVFNPITEENKEDVRKWRDYNSLEVGKIAGKTINSKGIITIGHNENTAFGIRDDRKDSYWDFGTEITYEQFKKYVIKQDNMEEI